MNADSEQTALNDPKAFKPRKGHRFIDVWANPDATGSREPIIQELSDFGGDDAIEQWIKTPLACKGVAGDPAFRLLLCAPRDVGHELTMPMMPSTYQTVARAWGFSPLVLCSIRQPFSIASFFKPSLEQADQTKSGTGLVIHFNCQWEYESAVAVVRNPAKNQVTVMVAGLSTEQIPKFLKNVRNSARLVGNPLLVPTLLLSELCQNQTDWLEIIVPSLNEIQGRLGMSNWKYSEGGFTHHRRRSAASDEPEEINFPRIMMDLNRMADSVRFQTQICTTLRPIVEELLRSAERGLVLRGKEEETRVQREIADTLTLVDKTLKSCHEAITYRNGTIEGLIHTVYTLLAQRDSYLSLDIAYNCRRDSTDMRIIAVVTLVFLPGMFTATLFSTSFFDFSAEQSSAVVSPYHWVYWGVTAGITAVVLAAWYYWKILDHRNIFRLPDINVGEDKSGMARDRNRAIYNMTDLPEEARRLRRFAGW